MLEMRKITEAELSVCREQMLKRLRKELTDVISKNTVYIYMVFCAGFLCCASWYCLRGFVREVIEDLIPCSLLLTCVLVLWLWLWLWLCMLLLTCVLVLWLKNLLESTQCSTVNPIAQVKDCIEKLRKVKRGDLYVEPIEILQKETLTVAGACYPNVPVYCIVLKGVNQ